MNKLQRLAESYRHRAEELRELAELDTCKETCTLLVYVANRYEKKAENADAIERSYVASQFH